MQFKTHSYHREAKSIFTRKGDFKTSKWLIMHPGTLTDICLSGIKIPEALALEAALGRVTICIKDFWIWMLLDLWPQSSMKDCSS